MSYITNHPKRTISGLATVLVAAGVAVGSGATFTSNSTANPANTFTAGTLSMSNSKPNLAILTAGNMKPGDTQTGTVKITNTGTLGGVFKLSEIKDSSTFATGSLKVAVSDVTDPANPVAVGSTSDVGAFQATTIAKAFAAKEARTYRFTVSLSKDAPNTDQGAKASVTYQWDASQEDAPVNGDSDK